MKLFCRINIDTDGLPREGDVFIVKEVKRSYSGDFYPEERMVILESVQTKSKCDETYGGHCEYCGAKMQIVRPGKWECPHSCEFRLDDEYHFDIPAC
jgi:hypothetical protein